jgi:hypothetical protein
MERATYASGQHGLVRTEPVDLAVLEAEGHDATALAVLHDQIEGEVLNEEGAVVPHGLTVEGVQEGVTGTISDGAAPEGEKE